jgi:pyrroline-5-carboxylate reductase
MANKPELINKLVQELNETREQSDEVVSIASGLFARY